ncbi:MAG TPA: zinc ribbon domain-containing protein [bacterium]|nr:zinc ribbon domain-containing protein [bacterium]
MLTYEYGCRNCKHRFELRQSINDDPVRVCPKCGGEVERIIGAGSGIVMKGGAKSGGDSIAPCGSSATCCGSNTPCAVRPCGK